MMLRRSPILLSAALLFLGVSTPVVAKKKPALPAIFATAQTVFVESKDGDITNLNLSRDQRDAILDVQDGMQAWGRYALARSRHSADLVVVVYKGLPDSGRPLNNPNNPGNPNNPANSNSPFPGASRNPASRSPMQDPSQADNSTLTGPYDRRDQDELRVYILKPDGKFGDLLWDNRQDNGLRAPNLQLLRLLKSQVDDAYPAAAKKP